MFLVPRRFKMMRKILCVLIYFILYSIVKFFVQPEPRALSQKYRVRVEYSLMFLVSGGSSKVGEFTAADGADVFAARQCGTCFITNNIGFLPLTEYDAILSIGKSTLLSEPAGAAFVESDKRYLMEASDTCIENKLRGCLREPKITSFTTRRSYNLCTLCSELLEAKSDPKITSRAEETKSNA